MTNTEPDPAALAAVDAVYAAYLALLASPGRLGWPDSGESPLALVSRAGVAAWSRVADVSRDQAETLWGFMISNGHGARWNLDRR